MSRLALFSYVYHHQKVRAAEAYFERLLVREYLVKKTIAGTDLWDLFAVQDALLYQIGGGRVGTSPLSDIMFRALPVRVAEFRRQDVARKDVEEDVLAFVKLETLGQPRSLAAYAHLLQFEDNVAKRAGGGDLVVVFDCPRKPSYADLESLRLSGRVPGEAPSVAEHLPYNAWIDAYEHHRLFYRFYCYPRTASAAVWRALVEEFGERGLQLPASAHVP